MPSFHKGAGRRVGVKGGSNKFDAVIPPQHRQQQHNNNNNNNSSQEPDERHNTEQPCCGILTRFALQVFPPPAAEPPKTANGNNGNSSNSNKNSNSNDPMPQQDPLPILLREYLLEERTRRKQQDEAAATSSKKKRKNKKKKKKTGAATSSAMSGGNTKEEEHQQANNNDEAAQHQTSPATAGETVAADETQGAEQPPDSPLQEEETSEKDPSSDKNDVASNDVSEQMDLAAATAAAAEEKKDENNINSSQRTEQQRRIQALLDRFLDRQAAAAATARAKTASSQSPENKTKTNANAAAAATVDLQQLHSYIATLTDSGRCPIPFLRPALDDLALLPVDQILAAVQQVQCAECRRDVERFLLPPRAYAEPLRLTGVRVPTVCDTYRQQEELEQKATQYQLLMEEGTAPPEHAEHWTWNRTMVVAADANEEKRADKNKAASSSSSQAQPELKGWKLQRPLVARPSTTTDSENDNWSMQDFDFLLQQYVMLQGLSPDTITGAEPWRDEIALESITDRVNTKSHDYVKDFSTMAQGLQKTVANFYETVAEDEDANRSSNVNWKCFNVMKDTDDMCDFVLNELLRICFEVTQSVQMVMSGHVGGNFATTDAGEMSWNAKSKDDIVTEMHWATTQCTALWQSYLGAAHDIFQRMSVYESKLFAINDGDDRLPEFFISPQKRALYRALVKCKIKACHGLIDKIETQLQHPTDIGGWTSQLDTNKDTTFLRRVLLERFYLESVAEKEKKQSHLRKHPVDTACEDVLTTIRECLCTVHGSHASKLMEEHHNRDEKLTRLLRNVGKHLEDKIKEDVSTATSEDEGGASTVLKSMLREVQVVNSTSRSASAFSDPESKMLYLKRRRAALGPALIKVMGHWVRYRIFYIADDDHAKHVPPIMPHDVRQRMLAEGFPCHGGNERSRAACILVGLFFRRLSDGFKNFQAHMAEQELLTTVEVDESACSMTPASVSKSGKKSKKKKGKKGVATVEVDEPLQQPPTPNQMLEKETLMNGGKCENAEKGSEPEEKAMSNESPLSIESPVAFAETQTIETGHGGDAVNDESVEQETNPNAQTDKQSKIDASVQCGVYDKSDFQTAEAFLVGRLTALLESGDAVVVRI